MLRDDIQDILNKSHRDMTELGASINNTIEKIEVKDSEDRGGFVSYNIHITSSHGRKKPEFSQTFRRYSEFEKLHLYFKHLYSKDKYMLLPKLPAKHGIQDKIMEFDENAKKEFENERRQDLEIYLTLLISNGKMKDDPFLKQFLNRGSIEGLTTEIDKAALNIPSTMPQKVVHAFKQTFQSVYKVLENWNAPSVEVEKPLKQKITKIEQIKATMNELLEVEMQRIKSLKVKQRELTNLKGGGETGILKSVALSLKQKILPTAPAELQTDNCLPCVQKLYNYIEMRCKQEDQKLDNMLEMKKNLKTMIAKCDSVLSAFLELVADKSDLELIKKKLSELDALVKQENYVNDAVKALEKYERYYKRINKMDLGSVEKGELTTVREDSEDDEMKEEF